MIAIVIAEKRKSRRSKNMGGPDLLCGVRPLFPLRFPAKSALLAVLVNRIPLRVKDANNYVACPTIELGEIHCIVKTASLPNETEISHRRASRQTRSRSFDQGLWLHRLVRPRSHNSTILIFSFARATSSFSIAGHRSRALPFSRRSSTANPVGATSSA